MSTTSVDGITECWCLISMVQSCLRYFFEYGSSWKTLMIFCQNTVLINFWVFHQVISNFRDVFFQKRFFRNLLQNTQLLISLHILNWIYLFKLWKTHLFLHWTKFHPPSFANINFGQSYIVSLIDQPFKAAVQAGNVGCATLFSIDSKFLKGTQKQDIKHVIFSSASCDATFDFLKNECNFMNVPSYTTFFLTSMCPLHHHFTLVIWAPTWSMSLVFFFVIDRWLVHLVSLTSQWVPVTRRFQPEVLWYLVLGSSPKPTTETCTLRTNYRPGK